MSGTNIERRAATTIGELDLHLGYVQQEIARLVDAVGDMATKQDIQELEQRMNGFALKADVEAVGRRLDALESRKPFDEMLAKITRVGGAMAAMGAIGAFLAYIVHAFEKVPK